MTDLVMPGDPADDPALAGVRAEIRIIDPVAAEKLLGTRPNRNISKRRVTTLAAQLLADLWRFNGEPIILNEKGQLLDGQHRLSAVSQSGVPIVTLVLTGVPDDVFHTLNTGTSRNISDVLQVAGESHTSQLAAAIRSVIGYRKVLEVGVDKTSWQTQRDSVPNGIALDFLEAEPGIRDTAEYLHIGNPRITKAPTSSGSHGPAIVLHETADGFPGEAEAFLNMAATGLDQNGQGLPGNHIALLYRNVLLGWATSGKTIHAPIRVGYTIKAWNAFISGAPLKRLTWKRGGVASEPFPTLITDPDELD